MKRRPLYSDDEYLMEVEGHGWYPSTRACTKMGGDGQAAPASDVYQILPMLRNAYEDVGD